MKYFALFLFAVVICAPAWAQYDYEVDKYLSEDTDDRYIKDHFDNPYEKLGRREHKPVEIAPAEDTYDNPFDESERGRYYERKTDSDERVKSIYNSGPELQNRMNDRSRNINPDRAPGWAGRNINRGLTETIDKPSYSRRMRD